MVGHQVIAFGAREERDRGREDVCLFCRFRQGLEQVCQLLLHVRTPAFAEHRQQRAECLFKLRWLHIRRVFDEALHLQYHDDILEARLVVDL